MDNKQVAQFIRYLRKSKHMTQRELADKLFVTDKAVSKWERGIGCPDTSLLPLLANVLDVTIEEILHGGRIIPSDGNNFTTNKPNYKETESTYASATVEPFSQKQYVKKIIFMQSTLGCIFGLITILLIATFIYTTTWENAFTWEYIGEPITILLFIWFIISSITGFIPLLIYYIRYRIFYK